MSIPLTITIPCEGFVTIAVEFIPEGQVQNNVKPVEVSVSRG